MIRGEEVKSKLTSVPYKLEKSDEIKNIIQDIKEAGDMYLKAALVTVKLVYNGS